MWLIAFIAFIAVLIYAPYVFTAAAVGGVLYYLYKFAVMLFAEKPASSVEASDEGDAEIETLDDSEVTSTATTAIVEDGESDEEFLTRQRAMNFSD